MKRILIIGIAGVGLAAMLIVGLMLAVTVTPARAQIAQAIRQAAKLRPVAEFQAQTTATPPVQLKAEKGILVGGVFQNSPADQAGLVRGDILLQVDGQAVNTVADLKTALSSHKAGDTLQLLVQHGDNQKTISVTLAESPLAAQNSTPQATPAPAQNQRGKKGFLLGSPYLGIIPVGVGQFKGEFGLDLKNEQPGAYIAQVTSNSPAEKAGLKVGEVITAVDGQQVGPQNSLSSLVSSHKPGDNVTLSVIGTDGTQRDVTVTLGDNPQNAGQAWLGVATKGRFERPFRGWNMPWMPGTPNGQNNGLPNGVTPGMLQHPGAFIEQVTSGSPAEKAGLKAGQLIEAVNGTTLQGPQDLSSAISSKKPGDTVTLTIFDPQAGASKDVQVTLGDNPQNAGSAWLGIQYGYINMQNQNRNQNPNQLPTPNSSGTQF